MESWEVYLYVSAHILGETGSPCKRYFFAVHIIDKIQRVPDLLNFITIAGVRCVSLFALSLLKNQFFTGLFLIFYGPDEMVIVRVLV